MAIVFRCSVATKVMTFTAEFDMIVDYKFSKKGIVYSREERGADSRWVKLGAWRWDVAEQRLTIDDGGWKPLEHVQDAWDKAYTEYVQQNLLS